MASSRPTLRAIASPESDECRSGSSATACSGVARGTWRVSWAGPSTYDAEYIALTQLQADAFVTMDAELARSVQGIVRTASIEALFE